ncbi:MurR/RpiR family transcriptional regulator [Hamadaea tsunoensis]|uniref:MurR/RpiR family transcriptional regulator n=1 Tax=Hamadaea tsunoensis TaxID=53368 RepID=UPI00042A6FB7|nr:MurR/RpiR family transcriptional regulator [Hamadaea tsunoensis]
MTGLTAHSDNTAAHRDTPPIDADSLLARLRGLLPSLPESEQAVGRLVIDKPSEIARASISELARRAGTSATTVTRFCRDVGLTGYHELRLLLAVAVDRQQSAGRHVPIGADTDIAPDDALPAIAQKMAHAAQRAIQDTLDTFDLEALAAAVEALNGAGRVYIYGVGSSDVVVADLDHKLSHLGLTCVTYADVHRSMASAAHLTPSDVVIAVSHSGRTAEVLDPVRVARGRGATTLAITNYPRSPLADLVDIVLSSAGRESIFFRTGATVSRIAQLYVADCLFVALAQRRGDQTWEAFDRVHDAVSSRHSAGRNSNRVRGSRT